MQQKNLRVTPTEMDDELDKIGTSVAQEIFQPRKKYSTKYYQ